MNADPQAASARARALLSDPPVPGANQRSALLHMMGNRAMGLGRMEEAARMLEASWTLVPSPARGVRAATAWYHAGRPWRRGACSIGCSRAAS